jgi:hypothetical protein
MNDDTDTFIRPINIGALVMLGVLILFALQQPSTVSAQQCAGTNHSGTISADERWCSGTHIIDDTVTVDTDVTLTIDPGARIPGL